MITENEPGSDDLMANPARQASGSKRTKRSARTPMVKPDPEALEPARAMAERIIDPTHEEIAIGERRVFDRPDVFGGPGAAAFEALLMIADARRNGWDWRPTGAVEVPKLQSDRDTVTLPWWIVVTLAKAWKEFALDGDIKSLDVAFGVETKQGVSAFWKRRLNGAERAGRAIQVMDLIEKYCLPEGRAIAMVADSIGLSHKSVSNNFEELKAAARRSLSDVTDATKARKRKAGFRSAP